MLMLKFENTAMKSGYQSKVQEMGTINSLNGHSTGQKKKESECMQLFNVQSCIMTS